MEPYTGKLSERRTRELFFNAQDDTTTQVFADASRATLTEPQEILPEAEAVNPYADLERRNAELTQVRQELAMVSDASQTLIKDPLVQRGPPELVKMSDMPAIIKQAAEAALLKKLRRR